jgi:membrane protease YdiL (CAAX protease family)
VTAPQPAAPSLERSQRRRLLVEVVIVLAIFPLPYVLNAVAALIQAIVTGSESGRIPLPITGHLGLSFLVDLPLILEPLAAAALVIYLLRISGEGGGRAIGLDSSDPRKDLALWLPVFLLCFLIPQLGVGFLLNAAHVAKVTPAAQHLPGYFAILTIADSLQAGIVEEIVVLGFLVRRLEQLGLRPTAVVVLAVLVRISYHVYYGWGVLPILAWALMSVIVYRRYRRLWPFIVVHALWDATIAYLPDLRSVLGLEVIVLSVATFVFWLMWRNRLTRTPDTSAWGPDRRAR